ncbi:hypothetical protein TSA6c_21310 [Azospirillum sp. TSA6c]|uniref:hypothetical protein n=1 Tax=Azospirillum sp. TSA6c TaxID=709813 RepID=UPI000D61FAAD|nr:hypothetical protein [Azospirillum sp. TSA6c]PWC48844.1 hypothetical protein TSA6c_21310 [Azospirillum sp. TSA6c]
MIGRWGSKKIYDRVTSIDGLRVNKVTMFWDATTGAFEPAGGWDGDLAAALTAIAKAPEAALAEGRCRQVLPLLLKFGRDRSDDGIIRALDDLAAEEGFKPLSRGQALVLIETGRGGAP